MNRDSTYCIAYEQSLTSLERELYHLRNPDNIIIGVLEAVCSFYDAEWAGVLDADLEMGIWTPIWWYNTETGPMMETRIRAFEITEGFNRWERALNNGEGVILSDIEAVRYDSPDEYAEYVRLGVRNIMGAPYHKRSMGFLVAKNPKRYAERIGFLQVMAYVIAAEAGERKLVDGSKMIVPPQMITKENQVYISLFGGFDIYTYRGKLTTEKLSSLKIGKILVYMLLHRNRAISTRELAEKLWPDEIDTMLENIRGHVYRFRRDFKLIADLDLIWTEDGKYHFNPNLTLITDLELFNQLCTNSANENDIRQKIHMLKKAARLYKGYLYPEASSEHWLMALAADYHLRYLDLMERLLQLLSDEGGYRTMWQEAARALSIEKGNVNLHYWAIYSLIKQGTIDLAKNATEMAKKSLTSEDYSDLIEKLKSL